jgi:hypothetical protein
MPKPIIFSTEMVQAILDKGKSVTRRIVKPQPLKYQIGDMLYVKETWRIDGWDIDELVIAVDYKAGNCNKRKWICVEDEDIFLRYVEQSAEDAEKKGLGINENGKYHWKPGESPTRWRSPIHMSKELARIFLKVTGVRIERLQDITEEGARAEGFSVKIRHIKTHEGNNFNGSTTAREEFVGYWNSLNEKSGWDWDANPWVWVIDFERISKEEALNA